MKLENKFCSILLRIQAKLYNAYTLIYIRSSRRNSLTLHVEEASNPNRSFFHTPNLDSTLSYMILQWKGATWTTHLVPHGNVSTNENVTRG